MTASDEPQYMPLRVTRNDKVADGIHLFEFRDASGKELPPFTAGAHVAIRTPSGLLRKYSLCNDPAERERYLVAIKREVNGRGGSINLIDAVKSGDDLMVTAPVNDFGLPPRAQDFVFIAGGIGITPMMAMIREVQAQKSASGFTTSRARRRPRRSATSWPRRSSPAASSSTTTRAIRRARSISSPSWPSARTASISTAAGRAR